MIEGEGAEAAPIETTEAAPEAAVSSQDTEPTEQDYELEAREMGWVPDTEWKGDKRPAKFLPAKDFVERGRHVIPILNKRLKRQEEDFAERLEKMSKAHERTVEFVKASYEKQITELRGERVEAIKSGDVAAVDRIDKAIDTLKEAEPEAKPVAKDDADIPPPQREWMKANPWFTSDYKMNKHAVEFTQWNASANPNISFEDNMKALDAEMRREFPKAFGADTAANRDAAVDGGSDFNGSPQRKDTLFAKLPPEAKAQCAKDVKAGLYKSNEDWARVYLS